jgi:EAL domain-containing protein (putative c-di-GMP-specific phosphodiesterase class I)
VDRRVIANLQERPHHQKFLNLMTHIGQDVEATLIFEGVETKSEYDYLFQHTQGLTQGFYFQKPAMGSEIKAFLDETAQRGRAAIRA